MWASTWAARRPRRCPALRWTVADDSYAPESFDVLSRVRVPTDRDRGYDYIVENTAALIATVARDAGLRDAPPVGIGMPGSVTWRNSDVALIKNSNTVCLNGRPFRRDVEAAVGRPVAFANDANCFALAEATFGAGAGAEVVFGVILGTGVGGGLVFGGHGRRPQAWDGAQGIAGEWGHAPIGTPGRRATAAVAGASNSISGPAIERAYTARTGQTQSVAAIAERRAVDPAADATLRAAMGVFGRAMATVINVVDPSVVVLGGGVSNLDCLYDEGVAAIGAWIFNDEVRTRVVKHATSDSAGVLGAALLPR